MTKYQDLSEFVNRAEKSRKYTAGTAQALRVALNLYETGINPEEAESIDLFEKNFDQITQSVFSKNASKFTAGTLATYKSRVQKVLLDFKRYSDPIKMNSWSPKVVIRPKQQSPHGKASGETEHTGNNDELDTATKVQMHHVELALRDGVKALIKVPFDLTASEAKRIKGLLDSLSTEEKEE